MFTMFVLSRPRKSFIDTLRYGQLTVSMKEILAFCRAKTGRCPLLSDSGLFRWRYVLSSDWWIAFHGDRPFLFDRDNLPLISNNTLTIH